jgi:hypothetical protein
MPSTVANSFVPSKVRSLFVTPQGVPTNFGVSVDRQEAADYIQNNGNSNPPFNPRTLGLTNPLMPDIQRGYIRRANMTSVGGGAVLYFMYNPPTITRDYLSYMDQAAIDPYNTLFQSGNSVAPPSMVQFSFDMVFDRQAEDMKTAGGRGALVDMDFFDLVVRNVTPGGGTTDVPDNGVMMINPEDIVVVFGHELTVQGRPINSRVQYQKFNAHMIPTVITISLTMIITYFGPLRPPFGLESGGQINDYQALVPYPEVNGPLNTGDIQQGVSDYNAAIAADQASPSTFAPPPTSTDSNVAQLMAYYGGGNAGSAAATLTVADGSSSTINSRAFDVAFSTFQSGTIYDQTRRTQIPQYADCSSLVWYCFHVVGASSALAGNQAWPTTQSMNAYWNSSGWRTMQRVMQWSAGGGNGAQLVASVQKGDVLFINEGSSHHIGIVGGPGAGGNVVWIDAASPSSNPNVGLRNRSTASTMKEFRMLLRPITAGSSTAANAVRNV